MVVLDHQILAVAVAVQVVLVELQALIQEALVVLVLLLQLQALQ
jgi:hypothetical protein